MPLAYRVPDTTAVEHPTPGMTCQCIEVPGSPRSAVHAMRFSVDDVLWLGHQGALSLHLLRDGRLHKLDQLTMGDFAAIKRQCEILQEQPTAEAFLDQLEAEHRLKPEVREGRGMGFVH